MRADRRTVASLLPGPAFAQITQVPGRRTFPAARGETLLDSCLSAGVELEHECGGNCCCTSCHVVVEAGMEYLSGVEEPEAYRLQFVPARGERSRLACQTLVLGGCIAFRLPDAGV